MRLGIYAIEGLIAMVFFLQIGKASASVHFMHYLLEVWQCSKRWAVYEEAQWCHEIFGFQTFKARKKFMGQNKISKCWWRYN